MYVQQRFTPHSDLREENNNNNNVSLRSDCNTRSPLKDYQAVRERWQSLEGYYDLPQTWNGMIKVEHEGKQQKEKKKGENRFQARGGREGGKEKRGCGKDKLGKRRGRK